VVLTDTSIGVLADADRILVREMVPDQRHRRRGVASEELEELGVAAMQLFVGGFHVDDIVREALERA